MTQLKLVAALVVALFAIVLEAEADQNLEEVSERLWIFMSKNLSPEGQANAAEALSFAKEYCTKLEGSDAKAADKLLEAWERVIQKPINCSKSSLGYIETIARCNLRSFREKPPISLIKETKKYASECLKADYIANKIKSRSSGCFSTGYLMSKDVKFIDHRFIDDYWSEHPGDRQYTTIEGRKSTKAMAKAIARDGKNKIADIRDTFQVHSYLEKHLYQPCSKYWRPFEAVMEQITLASSFHQGGYDKLISSLDDETEAVVFRYHLCKRPEIGPLMFDNSESYMISAHVASDLESLAQTKS